MPRARDCDAWLYLWCATVFMTVWCGMCGCGDGGAERDLVLWENMVLGSIAGGCAAAVTTPLDVAKTRLMTQTLTDKALRYTGIRHALRAVYAEGGVPSLFSGIKPRVLWISVGGAIFIGSFEEYKRLMARRL
jgi:solute carrier family 25 S-adenosylmethionine transporter 26